MPCTKPVLFPLWEEDRSCLRGLAWKIIESFELEGNFRDHLVQPHILMILGCVFAAEIAEMILLPEVTAATRIASTEIMRPLQSRLLVHRWAKPDPEAAF